MQDLERQPDLQAVALERLGQHLLHPREPFQDRVAVGEQDPRGTRRVELLAHVGPGRLAQILGGVRKVAEGPADELHRPFLVARHQRGDLHVLVARDGEPALGAMHEPLGRKGVEVAAAKAVEPRRGGPDRHPHVLQALRRLARWRRRRGPSAPPIHTQRPEALARTVRGRAPAARPSASAASSSDAASPSGRSCQTIGGRVGAIERIIKPGRRALDADRRPLQDQRHDLEALGLGASGQVVALAIDLLGQAHQGRVDEAEDRTGADVEELAQLIGIRGQLECQVHPPLPADVLADPVGVERVLVEAAANEVARQPRSSGLRFGATGPPGSRTFAVAQ